jgi:hypothetical protein
MGRQFTSPQFSYSWLLSSGPGSGDLSVCL